MGSASVTFSRPLGNAKPLESSLAHPLRGLCGLSGYFLIAVGPPPHLDSPYGAPFDNLRAGHSVTSSMVFVTRRYAAQDHVVSMNRS